MKETLKIKLEDLITKRKAFKKITSHPKLKINTMIDIERKIRGIMIEFHTFEKCQKQLMKRYGENGGMSPNIKKECIIPFAEEMNEVMEKEIEIEYERISFKELVDQGIELSIDDYTDLKEHFLIVEEGKSES